MRQWHCGNAFAQAQHDGGSRHSVKYQVLAMQGVPPGLDKNLVLCIGLDVLLDSKGDKGTLSHLVSTMYPSMFWDSGARRL